MLCPFYSTLHRMPRSQAEENAGHCEGEKCAIFDQEVGRCSVLAISNALRRLGEQSKIIHGN